MSTLQPKLDEACVRVQPPLRTVYRDDTLPDCANLIAALTALGRVRRQDVAEHRQSTSGSRQSALFQTNGW
jgi:hypothetical protein